MILENQIEKTFIDILTMKENQWTYRNDIKTEAALWDNLRGHINRINLAQLDGVLLTDTEFEQVKNEFRRLTQTPFSASQWLRGENGIAQISIEREDISKNKVTLTLFSNKDIAGGISSYEVVNQIVPITDNTYKSSRGDVTLLINGLPVIHIELKSEFAKDGYWQAFQQIERYAQSGFFDGIYATVQIFVISNKISTKYFARPSINNDFSSAKKFLFNWREPDEKGNNSNKPVEDLYDFTRKVLSIPMAHELISRFTILVDDKKSQKFMMVLRPYQIHAIKKIMQQAYKHEGGFIWHATGSGKTITSFVATKLLAQTAGGVARTVMIVDRKDLDSQTKNEFNKFASEYNTGLSSGDATNNTLIVEIDNRRELVENFLSKKNNNTIIITTIQKLSYAIRECRDAERNKFEKLKGEHIVFIVDECHRAVSDKEMKEIKKFFPKSTWIGLTGTPIFEENKKQENGTYARTTFDQYGELLHAYTTKNAMDDKSVLDFQVEYHSLMSDEEEQRLYINKIREKYPNDDPQSKLASMFDDIDRETLLENSDFENDAYIETMLKKIFRHQSILEKFKVVDGVPTMSGILTTHSIAQAKRIYHKLIDLKESGNLITGNPLDERRKLNDIDFPRIAITYSISDNQNETNEAQKEIAEIMKEYGKMYGAYYDDVDKYNININNRLARKGAQYQKDGQWLDLVIVVDRLLTGFDSTTIQTLYVDKELKWHGLLQAFSRTNRVCSGKTIGMIVTFRKPKTMANNVRDAIKLFSNEDRDWENLVPRQYTQVRQDFKNAYKSYIETQNELEQDPTNLKKQINVIKTFQAMIKLEEAIKSYEEFENDYEELSVITTTIDYDFGYIENLKAEVKEELAEKIIDDPPPELLEIEFSADQNPTLKEKIDSYYINQLLKDIKNKESKQKFDEIIKNKPPIVKAVYEEALASISDEQYIIEIVDRHFKRTINDIITETAVVLKVPKDDLYISFNEYRRNKAEVPYINIIISKSTLTKDEFEGIFSGEKFRRKIVVIGEYWKNIIEEKLLPLKEELANFAVEFKKSHNTTQLNL